MLSSHLSNFALSATLATLPGFAINSNPVPEHRPAPSAVWFAAAKSSSSNRSAQLDILPSKSVAVEQRIAAFFSSFAASQVTLGHDLEALLVENLASLYED